MLPRSDMSNHELGPSTFAAELAHIRRLVEKATAELERSNLRDAVESLRAARRTFEALEQKIAEEADAGLHREPNLQLAQAGYAIGRLERRVAAHLNIADDSTAHGPPP